jgi:phosphopantothenoylcysteine synthetase/decarboxylase
MVAPKVISVQANLKTLTKHQTLIIAPESGKQACGDIGEGRLEYFLSNNHSPQRKQ